MKHLSLAIFFVTLSHFLIAQCDYNNPGFESWSEQAVSFGDNDQNLQFQIDLPDDHTTVLRFFFYSFGIGFGDVEALNDFAANPQAASGISQSADSKSGDSAIKLQASSYINFADLYGVWRCTESPEYVEFSVKHVGSVQDTLLVLSVFDEGLTGLPQDFEELSSFPAYATTEITYDSNTEYETVRVPVTQNFEAAFDTAYLFFILTSDQDMLDAGGESYILIDDVNIPGTVNVVDNDMDGFNSDEDCDDNNPDVNPGADEIAYNGIDDDCNPATLDDDLDQDGFEMAEDCNDNNPNVFPGNEEICNKEDDNCDGQVDEGLVVVTYYLDDDGDGFGDSDAAIEDCMQPVGATTVGGDCDDYNPNVFPGNEEICNQEDDNCDGQIDEGLAVVTYYLDDDGDGFGDSDAAIEDCMQPLGTTTVGGDCDDYNPNVFPGNEEICNQDDDNCDGQIDEGLAVITYYIDNDGDGYGSDDSAFEDCMQAAGATTEGGDCDDDNSYAYPGAEEIPNNGVDEDCDGVDLIIDSVHELVGTKINIFPNPAIDKVNIDVEGELNYQVKLYNLEARLLKTLKNSSTIDIHNLPKGSYLLEIMDLQSGQKIVERVVKP